MRQLYAEGAFAPIPVSGGFVFIAQQPSKEETDPLAVVQDAEPVKDEAAQTEPVEGEEQESETAEAEQETAPQTMKVGYKIYRMEENTVNPVTRSVYLLSKFGINYDLFQHNYKHYILCKIIPLSSKQQLVIEPDGQARIVQSGDKLNWIGNLCFEEEPPCGVYLNGNDLWLSYTKAGAVVRYDIRSMHQEMRIGGGKGQRFADPEGVWADDNSVLICATAENRIVRLDLNSFELTTHREFDEPVRTYFRIDQNEIVQLDSGFYVL